MTKFSSKHILKLLIPSVLLAPTHIECATPVRYARYPEVDQKEQVLMSYYQEWRGTRYRLGGNTEEGIDCSSFIQQVFAQGFGVDIPRSAREQMIQGRPVDTSSLKAGDLLFFRSGPTRRHVAVYLGKQRFLHVSASRGVSLDTLQEAYWQRRFLTARRLLS
jgi:lipoprotein Spr